MRLASGEANAPRHPSSAGSIQKDLDAPVPKKLVLPSLEGGMLGSYNRKKESKMVVAKRQRKGKAPENGTKENPQTRVRTSDETNTHPSWPAQVA